ncbi:MAG: hypothetical protein MUE44_23065 [Oscillatoriaceae cyanobacterium Prado104]|jgi:hypothetical protein|nr:hypothetical protein [Oscillatoriaceae cyanobacterium Prado104]
MKGDGGWLLLVDDNEVNRDLLARRLQRQDPAVSVGKGRSQFNPVLLATRIGAGLAKQRTQNCEQDDLQKFTDEQQEKSERLLGKEETNG